MNLKNSKTSDLHRVILNLSDKVGLKRSDKYVALSNLSIYYTWNNIGKSYRNNKFEASALTQTKKFKFIDGPYFVSDIQNYYEYIIKKHDALLDGKTKTLVDNFEKRT